METNSVSSAAAAATRRYAAPARNELGKDDFLRLLITQLANQDPLSPVDNQAFIAQLAQFASVEQLQGLGTRLDTLLLAQASTNQMNVAGLVGKEVLYQADGVDLAAGEPAALQARLSAAASDVTAVVQDASGRTVRVIQLGQRAAGPVDFAWDGLDENGNACQPGRYRVLVSASGASKEPVPVDLRARGRVRGVSFDGEAPVLLVGSSRVALSNVVEIGQP
ncbi:MAG TPA: flagellar hook capping FlgD N-terminal domain-containing protein [Anaeromyxobacteraceae bacterium]|jgi:flagellar basal-body rod modification protein FlgD